MIQSDDNNTQYPGLFKDLLNRRVLQITGFYLGGSWGVLQFLDWIVERYLLSPLLVDLALTIVASLLPSIAIMAYFHGSPGKNKWKKTEKVFIPVNLFLTVVIILTLFGNKNLSSIGSRVSVTDESGRKIEKVVPKKGVVKELAIFFFDNRSGKKNGDWMQYGLVNMLMLDLSQDPFLNTKSPSTVDPFKGFYVYQKLKDAGFPEATGVPLMLQKNIADDLNMKNFMSGTINKTGEQIELKVYVYLTKDKSIVAEKALISDNIFSLVDELTLFVKKSLKLPSHKNREIVDLTIKDIYTDSVKAARLVTKAEMEILKNNDYIAAQKLFEEAVKADNTFTIAYMELSETYALNNKSDKWKSTYEILMKHIYKLPEKMQMQIKAGYYQTVKGEPEKAVSILKMIIKLYPTDIKNYSVLATRLDLTGNYEEAIKYYRKILEMEPNQYEIYDKIGNSYENIGDLENALINYKKYSEEFPKNAAGFLKIGKIEEKLGNFDKAAELYEEALLLDPGKTSTVLLIAGLDIKAGKFKEALEKYQDALETAKNSREKISIYSAMKGYYGLRGQSRRAEEMMKMLYENFSQNWPALQILIMKVLTVDIFLENGEEEEVKKFLDEATEQLSPPFDKIVSAGYILYYIHTGDLNKAESYFKDIETFVKQTGNKQIFIFSDRGKAEIARLRGNIEEALALYKQMLKQDRNSISVILKIAKCLNEINEYEEGLEYIKDGLKLSPFHPEANYTAALLYSAVNENDKAIKHLKRALEGWEESDPTFSPAIRAKELYNKLISEEKHVE